MAFPSRFEKSPESLFPRIRSSPLSRTNTPELSAATSSFFFSLGYNDRHRGEADGQPLLLFLDPALPSPFFLLSELELKRLMEDVALHSCFLPRGSRPSPGNSLPPTFSHLLALLPGDDMSEFPSPPPPGKESTWSYRPKCGYLYSPLFNFFFLLARKRQALFSVPCFLFLSFRSFDSVKRGFLPLLSAPTSFPPLFFGE